MENVEKKPKSTKNTNAKDVEKKVSTSKASKANATTQDRAVKSNASKQSASKRGAKTEPKQTDEVVKGQEVAVDTANVERNSSSDDFSIQSQGERIKKNAGKNSKRKKAAVATAVVLLLVAGVTVPTAVYLSRRKVSVDIANNIDIIQEYTINVNRGSTIKDIVPQEITGYTFVGFYKDAELTVPYKDTDKINKNMTIYAKYEANVYKVTFPTSPAFTIEGEDIVNNQVEIEYNTEYRFKLNLATGYDESDITVKVNGETVTPDQDGYYTLTIYGDTLVEVEGVEINTYEVTFYDSLEKNEIYQRLDIDYNGLCTYTGVTPTKHSTHTYTYTFIGWVDADGNPVDLSTTNIVTDLELFANFREEYIEYTISKPEQVNVKFGDLYLSNTATLHYGDIVEITYDTTEGHDVTAFSVSGAEKVEGSENQYKITGNLVVTYTEEIQTFTVQIESSNSEYGSINQSSITVEYGTEITVSGNTLTIGEYTITATPTADDPTYDYVFVNWTNAVSEVTGDITITANFERTMDEYVVSIVVNNASYGTVNKASIIVNYNTPITVDGNKLTINGQEIIATATASDAQYTYTFTGWTNATDPITEDREITANFTRETNTYTVSIQSNDTEYGTVNTASVTVEYGTTYTVEGNVLKFSDGQTVTAKPEENTAQYTYAFDNWSSESGIVNGAMQITATFSRETNTYTVTWKNWDGSTLETDTLVPYGTTPEYNGENPTRAQDENYKYTFSGWDQKISPVTGDVTYTAEYATTNIYTVTFYDENRTTVLYTEKVLDGEDSKYLTTPTKEADKTYTYTFTGWETEAGDPAVLTGISGNLNVYASYSSTYIEYKISIENETTTEITIKRGEDTLSTLDTVHYGDELIITYTPTTGTDGILVVSGVENIRENTYRVTGNVEIAYTEDYIDYDIGNIPDNVTIKLEGEELTTEDVVHFGDKLEITYTVPEGYNGRIEVTGAVQQGESNIYVVKGELSVEYSQEIQKFTVTWKNWDGSTLETDTSVPYGTTPEYNGEIPTRAQDENYKYTFSGWDQEISPVTGDVTYTAEYATTNMYTVTFYDENRTTVLYTEKVLDGEDSKYLTTPTKEADKTYTYTFAGWETEAGDPAVLTGISGNLNVYASYSSTYIEYDINISNSTGATLIIKKGTEELSEDSTVHYGDELTITYKESAGKEGTLQVNGATRREGTDEYVVAGDVTIIYSETYIEYTISSIPSQVTIKKGDEVLTTGNTLHYGDEISITYAPTTGKYMTEFEVIGATRQGETEIYIVTDNLTVRYEEEYIDYTIGIIPEGVKVERLGETLEDNAIIHYDDELKITYELDIGYDLVRFEIEGAIRQEETNIYKVEGNVTIRFEQRIQTYIVTIGVNNAEYGTVTESSITVEYGTTYTVEGNVLKFSDDQTVTAEEEKRTDEFSYTFIGWSSESGTITGTTTITANFTRETNTYTVSIQSNNAEYGTVTESSITVDYGTTYTVEGNVLRFSDGKTVTATPETNTAQYTYTFLDWTSESGTVTGETTITANFARETNTYTVSIQSNNTGYGTVDKSSITIEYGTEITVSGNTITIGDTTITATPADDNPTYDYVFVNWTNAVSEVTGDITITANFERTMDEYVVSIVVNNPSYGTVSKASVIVNYNTPITVDGNKLTINGQEIIATATASDAQYTYTFTGWTNATDPITGNREITANFTRETNKYVVTILSGNTEYGSISMSSVTVEYGTTYTVEGNALKFSDGQTVTATPESNTAQYTYAFDNWSSESGIVNGAMQITATFSRETNTYTVTWKNYDGSTLETDTSVPYGTTPEYNGETPTYRDETYIYEFTGWDQEISPVTGDVTYTAEYIQAYEILPYEINEDGEITKYTGSATEVVIPSSYSVLEDGTIIEGSDHTITGIADASRYSEGAFYGCNSLTSISIPDSVTSIGSWAFYYCSSLTSINIPDSVTSIGIYAFRGCSSLTSITIPDSVTSIGTNTFYNCTSLTSVTIGDGVTSIGGFAFEGCTSLTEINFNATNMSDLSSNNFVFYNAGKDGEGITVNIGANVTRIPAYLFNPDIDASYSPKITTVDFAESSQCTSIGSYAFSECSSLTSVTIADGVTSIGVSAFNGCTSLSSVTFKNVYVWSVSTSPGGAGTQLSPANLQNSTTAATYLTVTYSTYYWTREDVELLDFEINEDGEITKYTGSATEVVIPSSYSMLEDGTIIEGSDHTITGIADASSSSEGAFANTNITRVTIPDIVTSIGSYAFYNCTSLTSITIGDGVTSVGESIFNGCSSLTSITIPDSVTSIGEWAFYRCSSLTSITITDSVTSIEKGAFQYCTSLTSITIPDSVTSIGNQAFYECRGLTEINFNATNMSDLSQNNYVFNNAGRDGEGITVNIGANVTRIPAYLFNPYSYASSYLTNITTVNFAESSQCTEIGDYAFYKCRSLTSITIPDSVTSIGELAFYNCTSLTSITIPDSVTSIGSSAFRECSSLTNITIPDGVTSIGSFLFYECTSLTSITIPNSVTSIGVGAFRSCRSLESIIVDEGNTVYHSDGNCLIETESKTLIVGCKTSIIPSDGSVTSIGDDAFYGCSGLTSITIPDSVTSIGDDAFRYCTSLNSITIPDSVTSIGSWAFYDCSSLTSVTIESNYAYKSATSTSACGYLLDYATEVRVLTSCIVDSTNSYLEDTNNFTKTASEDGLYYIYTKI